MLDRTIQPYSAAMHGILFQLCKNRPRHQMQPCHAARPPVAALHLVCHSIIAHGGRSQPPARSPLSWLPRRLVVPAGKRDEAGDLCSEPNELAQIEFLGKGLKIGGHLCTTSAAPNALRRPPDAVTAQVRSTRQTIPGFPLGQRAADLFMATELSPVFGSLLHNKRKVTETHYLPWQVGAEVRIPVYLRGKW
jgi:hypothetical protein